MRTLKLATIVVAASLLLAPAAFARDGQKDAKSATPTASAAPATAKKVEKKDAKQAEGDYVCPMGPQCGGYHKEPGECPVCGMKLIHKSQLNN